MILLLFSPLKNNKKKLGRLWRVFWLQQKLMAGFSEPVSTDAQPLFFVPPSIKISDMISDHLQIHKFVSVNKWKLDSDFLKEVKEDNILRCVRGTLKMVKNRTEKASNKIVRWKPGWHTCVCSSFILLTSVRYFVQIHVDFLYSNLN